MIHDFTGLGDAASIATSTIVSAGTGAATGLMYGGPIGAAVGAAVGAVTALVGGWLGANKQTAMQKVNTTHIVDSAEPLLKQNLAAWQSSDKTVSEQAQLLANFNDIWNRVVQACNDPANGDPGSWCIHDRQRGGKWDWFSYYYDPIANDPSVKPDATSAVTDVGVQVSNILFGGNVDYSKLIVPVLLLVGGYFVVRSVQG